MNRRYQGIPAEILKYPDLLELLLPALRADVEALEMFRRKPEAPKLTCPTTVFGGALDRAVSMADLESLRDEVAGPCRIRMFPGDHFYIEPQRENLLAEIHAALVPTSNECRRGAFRHECSGHSVYRHHRNRLPFSRRR